MNNNRGFEDKRFDEIHEQIEKTSKEINESLERAKRYERNAKIIGGVTIIGIVAFIIKKVIED